MINILNLKISNDWISLIDLFHREAVCGNNKYLYTSVLAYGTETFLSCGDLVIVVGAGGGISSVGTWIQFAA